ncbi:formylglycine-generating enzyme family protein [Streptomyces geranii]|uniref:formylglycine-generating enzyme family protein n=1 Tax=Streptomyces geranii TaxID=2058923 RepID=UPI000D02F864|nr:SUMF1/EgtB/PvdO family nonheme iron enzyme [Streptomyces geranii]
MRPTSPGIGRRPLLALLTLAGAAALVRPSTAATRTSTAETAAETTTAAGQELAGISANPDFVFATDLAGTAGSGEASPIGADYWLGVHEVTNAQYLDFVTDTGQAAPPYWDGGTYPDGKADHPVLTVSLDSATAYCAWLNGQADAEGWTFRLPSEAEWEYAASGPDALTYPWGDTAGTTYADLVLTSDYNYMAVCAAYELAEHGGELATYTDSGSALYGQSLPISEILSIGATGTVAGWNVTASRTGFVYTDVYDALTDTGGYTTPVTAYPGGASAAGLLDLCGNCWEWTTSVITATHGGEMGRQVNAIRGGSWYANLNSCTAVYRGEGRDPSGRYPTVGFRVAATAG